MPNCNVYQVFFFEMRLILSDVVFDELFMIIHSVLEMLLPSLPLWAYHETHSDSSL